MSQELYDLIGRLIPRLRVNGNATGFHQVEQIIRDIMVVAEKAGVRPPIEIGVPPQHGVSLLAPAIFLRRTPADGNRSRFYVTLRLLPDGAAPGECAILWWYPDHTAGIAFPNWRRGLSEKALTAALEVLDDWQQHLHAQLNSPESPQEPSAKSIGTAVDWAPHYGLKPETAKKRLQRWTAKNPKHSGIIPAPKDTVKAEHVFTKEVADMVLGKRVVSRKCPVQKK
jgi:hypothetical protein